MNRITPYLAQGVDPSPARTLRRFARSRDRFLDARSQFDADVAALPQDEAFDQRFEQLEEDFEQIVEQYAQAEALALEILFAAAGEATRGVRVDDLIFTVVRNDDSNRPEIVVVDLQRVRVLS